MNSTPVLERSPKTWDETKTTTCYMCACRCGIKVYLKDGSIKYIEGNRDHPVNKGVICGKGAAGIKQHTSPSRLSKPLLRVGERGAGLSGGQRQRLAIARMILRRPRLLVLDEATSALDVDTERRLTANLMELYRGSTVFFITHRLASLKNADHILVMDQGALVEQGTHDQLMDLDGRYATLYHQQEV